MVLLRGRWLFGHILVIVVAATFIALGFWQLARHHEKHDKVRSGPRRVLRHPRRSSRAARPCPSTGRRASRRPACTTPPAKSCSATACGTARAVQIYSRRCGSTTGPRCSSDRGWVSAAAVDAGLPEAAPPTGTVIVRGLARASRPITEGDTVDERAGRLRVPRVDLDRIAQETGVEMHTIWIEAQSQQPPPDPNAPRLPQPPPPDQVNHLQYAIQWWLLALVPLVGWPILLVRLHRKRNRLDAAGRQDAP